MPVLQLPLGWSWLPLRLPGKSCGRWEQAGEPSRAHRFVGVLHRGVLFQGFPPSWVPNWHPASSLLPCQQVVWWPMTGNPSLEVHPLLLPRWTQAFLVNTVCNGLQKLANPHCFGQTGFVSKCSGMVCWAGVEKSGAVSSLQSIGRTAFVGTGSTFSWMTGVLPSAPPPSYQHQFVEERTGSMTD